MNSIEIKDIKENLNINRIMTPHERAKYVAFFAALFSALYHLSLIFVFHKIGLQFMFIYNIFSTALFIVITALVPKIRLYIVFYSISLLEVILHAFLANYFLGSWAGFHYLVLLMEMIPFLVFEHKLLLSIPYTGFTGLIFIVMECVVFPGEFKCANIVKIVYIFRILNISLSILTIISLTLLYMYITHVNENILSQMNTHLNKEINLAATIQQNFFKQDEIDYENWNLKFYNKPFAGVSGDMYDIFHTDKKLDGYTLMDVSGHGVSSGLVTMLVKNIIIREFYRHQDETIEEIVERINARVITEKGNIDNYLTGIVVRVFDAGVELVNAGHPLPLFFNKQEQKVELLNHPEESCGAIGMKNAPSNFVSQIVEMESGDELIFYTDGITEAKNKKNQLYGVERLKAVIEKTGKETADVVIESILKDLNEFTSGKELEDDITIMILQKK